MTAQEEIAHMIVMLREERERAVAEERAAVVSWLRESRRIGPDDPFGQAWIHACMLLARDIEHGEHRREEER